ncbi:relaxase/mobilization nuclease domain-containing protein [Streptomyces sp. MNP-20]|uniref:relaxase/mobilization nuclease domain-containing protein n=1 Tax=Streptomyces sp. MNP-20 TaxID=2721165 RepID=UPI001557218C|nr:relaxase/mobilization nuclease domain-containing protein [Streptomyces sp. MNP-20]
MIPSVNESGDRTVGLLHYLYGPGRAEEHIDPHLVASFDGMAPDPGRTADFATTIKDLAVLLDQPVQALPPHARPAKHVWHTSVRAAPGDRTLSDDEWADIAHRIVAATGIDPGDGERGCRWAAVRHADDHIHIVATLVCEDGSRPDDFRSGKRAQAECRLIEKELGLTLVNAGDGTAAKRPTSAEHHKAKRQGREQTAREELRETVRRAVAGASSEEEFFDRLTAAGLLVRKRAAPSGDLLGYTVALPDDRNADNEPVFFPGSVLAPDLSLPRIRERWSTEAQTDSITTPPRGPAQARRRAAAAAWQAVLIIDHGDDHQAAAHIAAAGEILDALAKTSAAHTRRQLREAARAFERATRSHVRAERGHDRALRQAARDLVYGGTALGRGEDGAATAMVIDMAFFLVIAAMHRHGRKNHAQQAAAAREAAEHLRAAYQAAAQHPMAVLRHRGRRLAQPLLHRQLVHLRQAVPELAEQILAEPGWHALAATLADAEALGYEPAALLTEAVARRELDSADSISDVLVWRLRRLANLPADASTMPDHSPAAPRATGRPKHPATGPSRQPTNLR